jgi:4-amino-4-deoxy-L-arabinose transferase-like glycosyltransferase
LSAGQARHANEHHGKAFAFSWPPAERYILAGLLVFSLAESLTHFGQVYLDSPGYVAVAQFFEGQDKLTGVGQFRLLRPVVPFLASLVNHFVSIRTSFGLVNLVFWCGASILMFYFTKLLTHDTNASLVSAALLTGATQMLLYAGAVLTDGAGYFSILLGMYLVIRWDLPRATLRRVCIAGLVVALGILSRESVASILIFALVWTILSKGSIPRAVIFMAIPILVAVLWSLAVGVSYISWYVQGGLVSAAATQEPGLLSEALRLVVSVQNGFGRNFELIFLAALGLLTIGNMDYLKVHMSMWVGALAVILSWPIIDTRYTFILFPSILPLAGAGLLEAYRIVAKGQLIPTIWPSFHDTKKLKFVFLLLAILVYALTTNLVLRGYISFPWRPYTDPSVGPVSFR